MREEKHNFIPQIYEMTCTETPFLRFGRDTFQEAMKLTHRMDPATIDWSKFHYKVFDVPTYPGLYKDRYSFLGMILSFIIVS
jgi:hypothetical protein